MTRKHRSRRSLAMLTLFVAGMNCLVAGQPAVAQDPSPEARGLEIAREARKRGEGFGNLVSQLTMVLRTAKGQESRRQMRLKTLEVANAGDKTLFVFDRPADVSGTAFLVHAHRDKPDDLWIFLPALNRVKRISSANQSGSFMGSEFAYEDITTQEIEKFTHKYLRDEPCGDLACTVSERTPVGEDSGYSRQLVWHDKKEYRPWRVEYYDRRNELLKTLTLADYELHLDRYWYAGEQKMMNHLTGKSTVLKTSEVQLQAKLNERDFTRTGLRRAR